LNKPVVIHCREAEADIVRMLTANGLTHGVMHSFTGDRATLDACLALGLHISFAGMVTYKNAENLRDLCKVVPADRLMIETDCPYLSPLPHRSRRNEPAYVVHTASIIAEQRGMSVADLGNVTCENAKRLFSV
jgi:TatD DNase family protein